MRRRRRAAALVVAVLVLLASTRTAGAGGDAGAGAAETTTSAAVEPAPPPAPALPPPLHFARPIVITTASGRTLDAPPGYYLADPTFAALDAELRRAQDAETRLGAENESLRRSASERPGLALLLGAAAIGVAAGMGVGVYVFRR